MQLCTDKLTSLDNGLNDEVGEDVDEEEISKKKATQLKCIPWWKSNDFA